MVIGNRFDGRPMKGAMRVSHRIGVRWLSHLGRRRFHADLADFHSGLRALSRDACMRLDLRTRGMEFATEMIALAAGCGMIITQTPVRLSPSSVPRNSKLRIVRDGLRHLAYIARGR